MDDRLLSLIQRLGIRTDSDCQRASDELRRLAAVEQERDRLAAKLDELLRWKSIHAPRIEALQGLKDAAQLEAAKGVEARDTLASERQANAILTEEVEALRKSFEIAMNHLEPMRRLVVHEAIRKALTARPGAI